MSTTIEGTCVNCGQFVSTHILMREEADVREAPEYYYACQDKKSFFALQ